MIKPNAPCKDCEERHIGCHAECDRYELYLHNHEAYKSTRREAKLRENMAKEVLVKGALRRQKARNR